MRAALLARIVSWWSVFTMLTAAAGGYASLLVIRFFLEPAKPRLRPNATRVFSRWIPVRERGRVQECSLPGLTFAVESPLPIIILVLQPLLGWRGVFLFFWCCWESSGLWLGIDGFRDRPEDHPSVSAAELAYIRQDGPEIAEGHGAAGSAVWRALLTSPHMWLLSLVSFASSYGFYFVANLAAHLPWHLGPLPDDIRHLCGLAHDL